MGTCGSRLFDPTQETDPNVILHFQTDQGLWGCQDACNRTEGCKFYTHSILSLVREHDKYAENPDLPDFRCILWRKCDKFFIPITDQWMHIRTGPKDCAGYQQKCPIVYGAGKSLDPLPVGYTRTPAKWPGGTLRCPSITTWWWRGTCGFQVMEVFKNLSHRIHPLNFKLKEYHNNISS